MEGKEHAMGVNAHGVVYEGVWHHQTLVPDFKVPNTLGDSLSGVPVEPPEIQGIVLEINERLLMRESSSLAERLNDAYGNELEPKERELLDRAAEQFGRRLSSEE